MDDLNFDLLEQAEASPELQYKISNEDYYNLLELVTRTTLEERQRTDIEIKIAACESLDDFVSIKRYLLMNIIESKDRIAFGLNFGMADINNTIRHLSKEPRKIKLIKL